MEFEAVEEEEVEENEKESVVVVITCKIVQIHSMERW